MREREKLLNLHTAKKQDISPNGVETVYLNRDQECKNNTLLMIPESIIFVDSCAFLVQIVNKDPDSPKIFRFSSKEVISNITYPLPEHIPVTDFLKNPQEHTYLISVFDENAE